MSDLNDPDLIHLVYQNAAEEVAAEFGGIDKVNYRETRLSSILERVVEKACKRLGRPFKRIDLSMEPEGRASAKLAKEVLDESRRRGHDGGSEGDEDGERSGAGALEADPVEDRVLDQPDREPNPDHAGDDVDSRCPF